MESSTDKEAQVQDKVRVDFYKQCTSSLLQAKAEGVNVIAYYPWTMWDNFEWLFGYTVNFGLVHVDFASGSLERTFKYSALWYADFIQERKDLKEKSRQEEL